MRVYFAAPLFSQAERDFNLRLTGEIEALDFSVFLPQRDGVESTGAHKTMSEEECRTLIFERDRDEVLLSDVFLFVLDGRVPDEGGCIELGMAYMQRRLEKRRRLIIGLQTDTRGAFRGSRLNPMVRFCMDDVVDTERDLLDRLAHYRSLDQE